MDRENRISLLLLAGGKSSRMGKDKAELVLNGKTFLDILLEKAKQLKIENIYLSGYEKDRLQTVWDIYPDRGPIGGIYACMRKIQTPYCLVLPIDVPQIPIKLLDEMIDYYEMEIAAKEEKEIPLLLEHQGFLEPLIGIYPVSMADYIDEKIKEHPYSVFRMVKEWGCKAFQYIGEEWEIANINTMEDYELLLKNFK